MNDRFTVNWIRLGIVLLLAAALFGSSSTHVSAARGTEPPSRRIEVSLSQQQLYAWQGSTLVYQFAVTTGHEGEETVPGQFEILDKEPDAYSEGWQLDMPFWMGIYQFSDYEDGFHALPSDGSGNVYWADALGKYPASHGCIVLSADDAETLFHWASVGTPVDIHD